MDVHPVHRHHGHAQILLLNTIKVDTFAKAYDQGAEISVTRDVAEQLTLSNSPFALALSAASVSSPTRELLPPRVGRCRDETDVVQDLDLAYRAVQGQLFHIGASRARLVLRRCEDAVFTQVSQSCPVLRRDAPFCEDKSAWISAGLDTVMPLLYFAAMSLTIAWGSISVEIHI
jgi:hypothetical protein